jgi:hypothetical protein
MTYRDRCRHRRQNRIAKLRRLDVDEGAQVDGERVVGHGDVISRLAAHPIAIKDSASNGLISRWGEALIR